MSNFAIPGGEAKSRVRHAKLNSSYSGDLTSNFFPSSGMDVLNIWGEVLLTLRIHQGESYLNSAAIYFTKSSGCSARYIAESQREDERAHTCCLHGGDGGGCGDGCGRGGGGGGGASIVGRWI